MDGLSRSGEAIRDTVAAAAVPHYRFSRLAGQVALQHAEVRDAGANGRLIFAPRSWHA